MGTLGRLGNRNLFLLLVMAFGQLGYCNAQTVEASETSMVMQVDGVSLTLKSTGCGTGNRSGSISAVASMFDVQHSSDTLVALLQPQINTINSDISNVTAASSTETIRAMNAESAETLRATSAEANLLQNQMNLQQNQLNLQNFSTAAEAKMLALFTKFESSTMATINNLSLDLQQTKSDLTQARATIASMALIQSQALASSSSLGTCPGNASSLDTPVFPDCPQGFSPSASSMLVCPGSQQLFPTTFSCQPVNCPANSNGINVAVGCACNAGFSGTVNATKFAPYFLSNCLATPCPSSSNGISVHLGCYCNAGFRGTVTATVVAPFFNYTCSAVSCPSNTSSSGLNLPSGCSCTQVGFRGQLTATTTGPLYYNSEACQVVLCPNNSQGLNVASGCVCNAGLSGIVKPTGTAPQFYESSCSHNICPPNSTGQNVFSGCACNAGFSGSVVATFSSPNFFTSTCQAVSCPSGSTGINVAAGCVCNKGCNGSINASRTGPNFYVGLCTCTFEFKTPGPFSWTAPVTGTLSVVVVAGGGSGGNAFNWGVTGGGGGAGGVIFNTAFAVTAGTVYAGSIGDGGLMTSCNSVPTNGGNSVFGSLTAVGGGYGGGVQCVYCYYSCSSGGSGGGGMGYTYTSGCASSSPLQGNSGGNGDYPSQHVTGGGGGAGGPGLNAQQTNNYLPGRGGPGKATPSWCSIPMVGGGGGGSSYTTLANPEPGVDGGGSGWNSGGSCLDSPTNANGIPNTGGGGGGSYYQGKGGKGGSGLVSFQFVS